MTISGGSDPPVTGEMARALVLPVEKKWGAQLFPLHAHPTPRGEARDHWDSLAGHAHLPRMVHPRTDRQNDIPHPIAEQTPHETHTRFRALRGIR